MKYYIKNITLAFLVILIGFTFAMQVTPYIAQAQPATNPGAAQGIPADAAVGSQDGNGTGAVSRFLGFPSLLDLINGSLAGLVNMALSAVGLLVSMAAYILNVSLVLTLHIKDFVDATPAIYTLWKTIRDITGLFFIFYLLYAAIQIVISTDTAENYGKLIKNIVVAGILINFSFFITSVLIDASNIVSQAIYNSMIPTQTTIIIDGNTTLAKLTEKAGTVGISNVFMNSLKIQTLYDTSGNKMGAAVGSTFRIVLIGITGIIIMITAAASFMLAAVAFIARLVILLFLLAFSPIWFASSVIPQLKEKFDLWKNLYSQLIFMPVYLLLMYAALKILNESNIMGAANSLTSSLPTGTNWAFPYIILAVNFTMVIIMLNMPLAVGLSMGGMATDWMKKSMSKWDIKNVWGNVGGWARNQASWTNTGGRVASKVAEVNGLKEWASQKGLVGAVGKIALKGTRGAAVDYNKKIESQIKTRTEFSESLGYDEKAVGAMERHITNLKQQEIAAKAAGNTAAATMLKSRIEQMENKVVDKKQERQARYAGDLASKGVISAAPNLWMKVARKDKVAAAKINVGVWQKQLDAKKDDLKDARNDLKQIENDIKADIRQNGAPSGNNIAEKARLQTKINNLTSNPAHNNNIALMGVKDIENLINQAKLIK